MADIYDLAQEQKDALLENERRVASRLVRAYGLAYGRIQARISALTAQIDDARARGAIISAGWLHERDRLTNLKIEIEREIRRFAQLATEQVTAEQASAIETASDDAQRLLSASAAPGGASPSLSFGALNPEAVAALAGFAGDGSPLRLLFDKIAPQMAQAISDELVSSVIEGAPARAIASRIRERSGIGLARALTISRTETIRAYRETAHSTYVRNGDVLEGWYWQAAIYSGRTCLICLLMHGRVFPLSVKLQSHPNCRCVPVPLVKGAKHPETGIEWLKGQTVGVQKDLLGAKYEYWKSGKLDLNEIVGVRYSPVWGTTRYERSLKDILEQA